MEYLLQSEQKSRTWVNLREWLLLAARILVVLLAVLLLAQPRIDGGLSKWLSADEAHYLVVLDDSYSMSDRSGGTPVWDEALATVSEIARAVEQNPARRLSLLRTSDAVLDPAAAPQTATDREALFALTERVASQGPSQTAGGLDAALAIAARFAESHSSEGPIVAYIVSDFRQRDLDQTERFDAAIAELELAAADVHLAACTTARQTNITVSNLRLLPGARVAGLELTAEVTVQNFGAADLSQVTVRLTRDGQPLPAVAINDLPARGAASTRFPVRFDEPGEHRLIAEIEADAVAIDNRRYFATELPEHRDVILVDGSPGGSEGIAFAAALRPFEVATGSNRSAIATGWRPQRLAPTALAGADLQSAAAVLLLDVPRLSPAAVDALERYVASGGGLFAALGASVDRDAYDERLFGGKSPLLPLTLDLPTQNEPHPAGEGGDLVVTDHPLFRVFSGDRNSFLELLRVDYYHGLKNDLETTSLPMSAPRAIASLRSGAPLMLESTGLPTAAAARDAEHNGRVVALLTTVGRPPGVVEGWSNLGRSPVFPILVNELVAYLAAPRLVEPQPVVGRPWGSVAWPAMKDHPTTFARADEASSTVAPGDESTAPLRAGWRQAVWSEDTGPARTVAVNVDPREGDLVAPTLEELRERMAGTGVSITRAASFSGAGDPQSAAPLYRLIGGGLLLLLIAEQFLAVLGSYHQSALGAGRSAGEANG